MANTAKHGDKKIVTIAVRKLSTFPSKDGSGTFPLVCEKSEYNKSGVFKLSPDHLVVMAGDDGIVIVDEVRTAIQASGGRAKLQMEAIYTEKGKTWLPEHCRNAADKAKKYNNTGFKTDEYSFIFSEAAQLMILEDQREVTKELAKEKKMDIMSSVISDRNKFLGRSTSTAEVETEENTPE